MTTTETNKLIAEFMETKDDKDRYFHESSEYFFEACELEYHTSWDWLMPVVDKIDLILPDDNLVTMSFNGCFIEWYEKGITFEGLGNSAISLFVSVVFMVSNFSY